jgi:hypothetical protein
MAPQISAAKDAMVEQYRSGTGAMKVVSLAAVIASFRHSDVRWETPRSAFPR